MDTNEIVSVKTKVIRALYPRTEEGFVKGFCIFSTERGCFKGTLPFYPRPGMELEFKGRWETYQGNLQFKFFQFSQNLPTDEIAFLKYIATLADGIGPKTVDSIIEKYGADWRSRLNEMSDRIANPLRATMDLLGQNQARTDVVTYLLSIGGTPRMGELAYEKFKDEAIATLKQNIYALTECSGVGFRTVDDRLRGKFGILDHDPRRSTAAVQYAIRDLFDSTGNTVVERSALLAAVRALNVPEGAGSVAIDCVLDVGILVRAAKDSDLLTTKEAFRHETEIARYASETVVDSFPEIDYTTASVIPDDSQKEAIAHSLNTTGASIINGGAGSGKTTIVKIIADNLKKRRVEFSMCAFAGKAAARLREATGHSASTIHSMLGYQGEARGFMVDSLEGQTIIVDEASMLPSWLLYEICKRNPERLILVGDQAQIPPVGIGQPFHDMIKHCPRMVRTVTTCYRNKEAIFQSAIAIREGNRPASASSKEEKFVVKHVSSPEEAHNLIAKWVSNNTLDFETDVILSPRNGESDAKNDASVNGLNKTLQMICNPHANGEKFKVDDRVMFTANFAKEQAWNGTTGWIHSVDSDGCPTIEVDSPIDDSFRFVRCASADMRKAVVPCYAMTMHKSQGSQYRRVVIVCLRRDLHTLLDRALLYTAVTRAKKACVVLTDCDLQLAINSVRERKTLIQLLLAK